MYKSILLTLLGISSLAAETNEVGVIITNYYYDQWGRPAGQYSFQPNANSDNPYYPYVSPYDYYPANLPGSDPNRFEELYNENIRRR